MALSANDLKLLRSIVELGQRIEKIWPSNEAQKLLIDLKAAIASCSSAEAESLSRLSAHDRHLSSEMTSRHLLTILVPFERLLGRTLRDDEIFIQENDGSPDLVARDTRPLVVVADHIRSAFNVGAILRTAEALGAERAVLTGYSPTPDDEKTARTSMGAQLSLPWTSRTKTREAIDELKNEGYSIIALETAEDAQDIDTFEWPERSALILGNERFGIDHETLASVDHLVRIPLHGIKNSLNVGIACGIAIQAYRRCIDIRAKKSAPDSKLTVHPIGFFRCSSLHPYEARRQGSDNHSNAVGIIEFNGGQNFQQALKDLEGFERVWLIYQFHRNQSWKPQVIPPRGPRIKRGVFATRSPYRPNPIGLSCVRLEKIEGLKVFVSEFDLLDGSPVLDIKPYLPYADAFANARAGWTTALDEQLHEVRFSTDAENQLQWLESQGVTQIRDFLRAQLEYAPLDEQRKRVAKDPQSSAQFVIAYRTWRATFSLAQESATIEVIAIHSGYSDLERRDLEHDKYSDKTLHQAFVDRFT